MSPDPRLALVVGRSLQVQVHEDDPARVAPSVLSVATVGTTASRAPGSSTAAKRTDAHSQQLRLSVIAARFAKELHFAHTAYYRPEELPYRPDHEQEQDWVERVWRGVSNVERVALIQQAADLLLELAPDLCPKCTQAYVAKGSDFCSVQCSIDAENNR